jgi:hypothetical protein
MPFISQPTQTDKSQADNSGLRLIQVMKTECKRQFELAWKKRANGQIVDKTVAEAQAFFNSYGDKAVLAFNLHAKLQEIIYMTDNTWIPLVPPHEYVKNEDGTVTIGEPV